MTEMELEVPNSRCEECGQRFVRAGGPVERGGARGMSGGAGRWGHVAVPSAGGRGSSSPGEDDLGRGGISVSPGETDRAARRPKRSCSTVEDDRAAPGAA